MVNKSLLSYFQKGFSLANHSLEIYLIGLFLSSIGVFANLLGGSIFGKILQLISLVSLFFFFSYQVSIPLLLTFKQKAGQIDFKNVWATILKNTKRMILPVILSGALLVTIFLSVMVLYVVMSGPSNNVGEITISINDFVNKLKDWNPLFIVFSSVVFALFAFGPIYFSIENEGFLVSLKRSLDFSFKHINFVALLILISLINSSVFALINMHIEYSLKQLVLLVFTHYTALIISSGTLLFYQDYQNS